MHAFYCAFVYCARENCNALSVCLLEWQSTRYFTKFGAQGWLLKGWATAESTNVISWNLHHDALCGIPNRSSGILQSRQEYKKCNKRLISLSAHNKVSHKIKNMSEDYIAVWTGEGFVYLNESGNFHRQLTEDPMMKDVQYGTQWSDSVTIALKQLPLRQIVLYVALLYMDDSPTYYIGKSLIEKTNEVQVQMR